MLEGTSQWHWADWLHWTISIIFTENIFFGYEFAFPDFDASATTHAPAKCLISSHDILDCIASDQGSNLAAKDVQHLAHAKGMNGSDGILYHLGVAGLLQRWNGYWGLSYSVAWKTTPCKKELSSFRIQHMFWIRALCYAFFPIVRKHGCDNSEGKWLHIWYIQHTMPYMYYTEQYMNMHIALSNICITYYPSLFKLR